MEVKLSKKAIIIGLLVFAVSAGAFVADCEIKDKHTGKISKFSVKTGNEKLLIFSEYGTFSYPFKGKHNESYLYLTSYGGSIELGKIINSKFSYYEDGYRGTCCIK